MVLGRGQEAAAEEAANHGPFPTMGNSGLQEPWLSNA
ncbi:MAG: hypothetical protein BMS9Abin28_2574 [Anaerolineae bacterium]|nr:MAG: hypothetical protein BMS9Abin28_2574 [Anaerolineae bacterium]